MLWQDCFISRNMAKLDYSQSELNLNVFLYANTFLEAKESQGNKFINIPYSFDFTHAASFEQLCQASLP